MDVLVNLGVVASDSPKERLRKNFLVFAGVYEERRPHSVGFDLRRSGPVGTSHDSLFIHTYHDYQSVRALSQELATSL